MIDYYQAFWLALVQGLTEFLPISSSGHLALMSPLLGWPDQGLAFDVAVHVGSLFAVLLYFRRDLAALAAATPAVFSNRSTADSRLLLNLCVASLPVLVVGYLLQGWIEQVLRGPLVIAAAMIGFGVLLWWSDQGDRRDTLVQMTLTAAVVIGLAQALALIPGTSRSGVTLTAALFLGFTRIEAARFSFLLSIPVIFFAGLAKSLQVISDPNLDTGLFVFGVLVSAISAYVCIALFLGLLERIGTLPFVIYRFILGTTLFVLFL